MYHNSITFYFDHFVFRFTYHTAASQRGLQAQHCRARPTLLGTVLGEQKHFRSSPPFLKSKAGRCPSRWEELMSQRKFLGQSWVPGLPEKM